jgi:4-amino-4-deoxy-L-arabinose transferase
MLLCLVPAWLSWQNFRKQQYARAAGWLVLVGFLLRLFVISDGFLNEWDERYHALVARNMMEQPLKPMLYAQPVMPYDFKAWGANHIWVHKQPLPLWSMAGSMRVFGVSELALRLPSLILTVLGIWIMYGIGSRLMDRRRGYLAALLFAVNGLIIEMAGGRAATDHIDIFFLFFTELSVLWAVLFAQKGKTGYNVLTGLSIGLAILCKWLPALVVLPIWLLLVWDAGKLSRKQTALHLGVLCATIAAVVLPWQLYIFQAFPKEAAWEATFNYLHIIEGLDGHGQPFYFFFDKIRINYGELIYLPLAWFTWTCFRQPRNLKRWAVWIWFVIPLVFFSAVKTKMQAYLLFTAPALFLMTADCWCMLADGYRQMKYPWLARLVMILLLVLPLRYTIERVKPFDKRDKYPQWVKELKALPPTEKTVLFNYGRPIEAMFYTGLTVYAGLPAAEDIQRLKHEGYTLWINDTGSLDAAILADESIRKVKLTVPQ